MVLEAKGIEKFPDFITLDTEGFNMEVLSTMNFEKYRPKVICVETIQLFN